MKKSKVVIKQKTFTDSGFTYVSKHKGDDGLCFTMAIGFAVQLAKDCGISLTKVKELVTDIYKETEDVNNGND